MINYKTKRIHLRPFTKDDANLIYQLDGDSDVMKYITLGIPRTLNEVNDIYLPKILKSYSRDNAFGIFAAYLNNSDEYIGWFQFEIDNEFENSIEIGWRLKKQYWGSGYATEVAKMLSNVGVGKGKTIVARAMLENKASIRIMEKAGLTFVKEFWGDYQPHSGSHDVLYKRHAL